MGWVSAAVRKEDVTGPVKCTMLQCVLHWTVALLVAVQLLGVLAIWVRPNMLAAKPDVVVQFHISVWALVFGLMLLRGLLRLLGRNRSGPLSTPKAHRVLAGTIHACLDLVLIALPLTAWAKLAFLGYPVTAFGVPLPVFEFRPDMARRAGTAHHALSWILGGLVFLHILVALVQSRLTGQPVLGRMGFG